MTAQTLRDAAKVLRERAAAATPGPWRHETYGNGQAPLVIGSDMAVAETFDKPHLSDAAYITTVHPGVGLALADLLDMLAGDHEQADVDGGTWDHGAMPLARAIISGDA